MSTDIELATIYSFSDVRQGLNSLLVDYPRVKTNKVYFDDIKDIHTTLDFLLKEDTTARKKLSEIESYNLECRFRVTGLEDKYEDFELHTYDIPEVGVVFDTEFQGLLTDKESLLLRLYLNNQDVKYVDNFLGASAIEYIFSKLKPKYSWLAYFDTLNNFKLGKLKNGFHKTPWLYYSETMIYGPELVNSMRLKDFDWQDEDIFFAKWIAEDVLWLASPWGQHSRYQDFGEAYVDFHNAHLDVQMKHMNIVSERLNLQKGSW